ncbi:hypothetical protein EIP91_009547 [Steccherinum ochraceum]|uniref:Uncharacterized protein n=1 Tax=Steccherinum ochraceum TaxID=92696 RepID=A0A4R0RE76_9APHY|nr:hypothetical protein EIP91_009547 [Steccherinum ochraceum]
MMKSFFALAALAASAYAQTVTIAAPAAGATVTAGQSFVVDVAKPNTISGSEDVSVVIGLGSPAITTGLGRILFAGPYTPTGHPDAPLGTIEFYQNITVTVPTNVAPGEASLRVAHFVLVGADLSPTIDSHNVTINVVGGSA